MKDFIRAVLFRFAIGLAGLLLALMLFVGCASMYTLFALGHWVWGTVLVLGLGLGGSAYITWLEDYYRP